MINIAIVGAGAIAKVHVDAFLAFPELCEIKAVCNWHSARAQRLIENRRIASADAFQSLEAACAARHIDAVAICLPPAQHAETVVWALSHGLHVICEKPMANSLEECDRMLAAAKANNVQLAVICQLRCTTQAKRIKALLASGDFGKPLYTNVQSNFWRGENYHQMFWRGTWESEGGGVLTIQAIHQLDLMQYLLGMPQSVSAVMANVGHGNSQTEDVVSAALQYPSAFAQFNAALVAHGEQQTISIYTEKCRLAIPWSPDTSMQLENGYPARDTALLEQLEAAYQAIPAPTQEHHKGQVLNFLHAIEGKEALLSDGEEGRKTIELITAIYLSAIERHPVSLPLQKDCRLYSTAGKTANLPHFNEKRVSVSTLGERELTLT